MIRRVAQGLACLSLLLGAMTAVPARAQSKTGPFVELLQALCTSPGVTLERRVARLHDWRTAGAVEQANLLAATAEADAEARMLLGLMTPEDAAEMRPAMAEAIGRDIARPPGDPKGGARLLMHPQAQGVAVLIRHIPSPKLEVVGCKFLLNGPAPDVVAELSAHFALFPPRQSRDARVWSASAFSQTEAARRTDDRSLVLLRKDGKVAISVLSIGMTVIAQ